MSFFSAPISFLGVLIDEGLRSLKGFNFLGRMPEAQAIWNSAIKGYEIPNSIERTSKARKAKPVDLHIVDTFLERQISPVRLPKHHLRNIAELDIENSTPLDARSVSILAQEITRPGEPMFYAAVKTEKVRLAVRAAAAVGLSVRHIVLRNDNRVYRLDHDKVMQVTGSAPPRFGFRAVASFLLALVVALFSAGVGQSYWRLNAALDRVEAQKELLQEEVHELGKRAAVRRENAERVARLRSEYNERATITDLLEEITRVVPDSAWLSDLEIKGSEVRMTGMARSASSLIAGLDSSRFLENPRFVGQIVRDTRTRKERFTIVVSLEGSS